MIYIGDFVEYINQKLKSYVDTFEKDLRVEFMEIHSEDSFEGSPRFRCNALYNDKVVLGTTCSIQYVGYNIMITTYKNDIERVEFDVQQKLPDRILIKTLDDISKIFIDKYLYAIAEITKYKLVKYYNTLTKCCVNISKYGSVKAYVEVEDDMIQNYKMNVIKAYRQLQQISDMMRI